MTLTEGVRIRRMAIGDLNAVMVIERESESAPHWGESDYLALFESDSDPTFKRNMMIAEGDGVVVGFVIVRLAGFPGVPEAELESIVVSAPWQRRGVGRLLLSESAREARELGAFRVELEVRASNAPALRLYRAAGFVETGRRRAYYRDPEEDAVLMSVTL